METTKPPETKGKVHAFKNERYMATREKRSEWITNPPTILF